MTTDLTRVTAEMPPAANTAPDPTHPTDADVCLYVSEEFAQLLDSITAARAQWDADAHPIPAAAAAGAAGAQRSPAPEPMANGFAVWEPLAAASRT